MYSGKGNPGCDSDAFKAANTQLFKTDEVSGAKLRGWAIDRNRLCRTHPCRLYWDHL